MKPTALLAFIAVTLSCIPLSHAVIISVAPGNVTSSSEINDDPGSSFNRQDDFLVNGSGLTGLQHTRTVEPNMWLSTGSGFGGVDTDPFVQFDLGAVFEISAIQVWNYNEAPPNLTGRGVNDVTIEFGTTAALGSTIPGITNFAQANGLNTYTGEVFNTFTPIQAQFIRFDIDSNHGDPNTFFGLSEVQFDGTLLVVVGAVPEPSSVALLGAVITGMAFVRRRRKG